MNKDNFYINDLSEIRAFCINSDKEDVYKYIYCLQQENKASKQTINELSNQVTKLIEEKHNLKVWLKQYIKLLENKPDIIEEGQIDTLHEVLDYIK